MSIEQMNFVTEAHLGARANKFKLKAVNWSRHVGLIVGPYETVSLIKHYCSSIETFPKEVTHRVTL